MIRWTSLRCPAWSSERILRAAPEAADVALALTARDGAREVVVACSRAAAARGVRVGRPPAAARALCPGLVVRPHDPDGDRRALETLAAALLRFTPDVVLDGPGALLLETGRTAARFGGEAALLLTLRRVVAEAGFAAALGAASRPAAARCLARAATAEDPARAILRAGEDLRAALAPLPWSVLAPEETAAAACRALGLRTVGDVLALPRAALPSRFGPAFSDALATALGERAEATTRFVPPPGFAERIELWRPVEDVGPVLFAATRLFASAEAALDARESGATEARLRFALVGAPPYDVALRPQAPLRATAAFVRLLQHRFERTPPPGPVESILLEIAPQAWAPLRDAEPALFDARGEEAAEEIAELRDRLAVRLGAGRVLTAALANDHRPERAFRFVGHGASAPADVGAAAPAGARPLEVYASPVAADVVADADGAPRGICGEDGAREPLRVVRGPERVAAGWWDGGDVERAYFEVETRAGLRLWLFRDLVDGRFFRHGAFL